MGRKSPSSLISSVPHHQHPHKVCQARVSVRGVPSVGRPGQLLQESGARSAEEADLVEDVWQAKTSLSASSNYLLGKVVRKVTSLKEEGVTVTKSLVNMKDDVEKFVVKAQETTKKLLSISNSEQQALLVYKEVNRELGSIEIRVFISDF